jgi:hypothetical protein
MVAFAPASLINGGVISCTVIVWVRVPLVLPQASVAIHVLVSEKVPAQLPSTVVSGPNCVTVAELQLSLAVGAVNVGDAGQSIVASAPALPITGGVTSCTVMVWVRVPLVLPQASVAIQARVSL